MCSEAVLPPNTGKEFITGRVLHVSIYLFAERGKAHQAYRIQNLRTAMRMLVWKLLQKDGAPASGLPLPHQHCYILYNFPENKADYREHRVLKSAEWEISR
jgi:hypothetical protein